MQTVEGFINRYDIDIKTRSEVEKVDPKAKTIEVLNLENGQRYFESYDKLILSPGAAPLRPPVPGIDHPNIFTLRSVPDTDKIKKFVSINKVKRAIVVGGGFIGLEMAENLHELGIEVFVVEMTNQVMAPVDYSMASIVHSHLRSKGVGLILGDAVDKFTDKGNLVEVSLKSGKSYETDMVIWSIGVKPETKLAKDAGLEIGMLGGIKVNEYMQTSDKDIYAVGDAVEVMNPITGKPALIPLAGPANKQA